MRQAIPASMRAVVRRDDGGPPTVAEVPVPQPGPGQVLVRMAAAPINPSDLGFLKGAYQTGGASPIPGFEGSGTVIAAGPGLLPRLWLGKRVACSALPGAGGTWAEFMVTSAMSCIPLPGSLPLEQGAMLIVNPLTALAFFEIARRGGHPAMVSTAAAGALGRMILRLGQTHGVPVIHVVRQAAHVSLLASMGARYVLDSSAPGFADDLRTLAGQLRATLVLDPVAGAQARVLFDAAPDGSTLLLYGALSGEEIPVPSRALIARDKRIEGFFLGNWIKRRSAAQNLLDVRRVRRLASSDLHSTVHARFPLSQVEQAIAADHRQPKGGKILLIPESRSRPVEFVGNRGRHASGH